MIEAHTIDAWTRASDKHAPLFRDLTILGGFAAPLFLWLAGVAVASALVDFVNAINGNVNEGESAGLVLSGTIPLLRGFGMVNLEPFIESERKLIYEVRNFEDFRRSFVVDISRLYFNLLAQQQGIRNRRINLAQSTDLRIRSQELYNANRLI